MPAKTPRQRRKPFETVAHTPAPTHYDQAAGAGRKSDADLSLAGQERGERVETGKSIARGGKATGHVPGAMEPKK